MMRVALIGYGAVAAVHAGELRKRPGVVPATVCGPDEGKARRFAAAHGVERAVTSVEAALEGADAAIVCSPTPKHAAHASEALRARVPVLVELPPCETLEEAEALAHLAASGGVSLHCAHTSRYIEQYLRLGEWLKDGVLGTIEQVQYLRSIPPRTRSWTDDALLHHAAHPLDLFLQWFGALRPVGCAAHPDAKPAQNLAVVAELPNGAPVALSISYTSRLGEVRMTVVGCRHTVATDGFSYIRSDLPELCSQANERESYAEAIGAQDAAFLQAVRGEAGCGVPWEDTVRLLGLIETFRELWSRRR